MSLKVRVYVSLSWALFCGGIVAWPVSQFTFAKDEPPLILALSWLAIIVAALGVIVSADVRREQDNGGDT
jgi:hypothetical protein